MRTPLLVPVLKRLLSELVEQGPGLLRELPPAGAVENDETLVAIEILPRAHEEEQVVVAGEPRRRFAEEPVVGLDLLVMKG